MALQAQSKKASGVLNAPAPDKASAAEKKAPTQSAAPAMAVKIDPNAPATVESVLHEMLADGVACTLRFILERVLQKTGRMCMYFGVFYRKE